MAKRKVVTPPGRATKASKKPKTPSKKPESPGAISPGVAQKTSADVHVPDTPLTTIPRTETHQKDEEHSQIPTQNGGSYIDVTDVEHGIFYPYPTPSTGRRRPGGLCFSQREEIPDSTAELDSDLDPSPEPRIKCRRRLRAIGDEDLPDIAASDGLSPPVVPKFTQELELDALGLPRSTNPSAHQVFTPPRRRVVEFHHAEEVPVYTPPETTISIVMETYAQMLRDNMGPYSSETVMQVLGVYREQPKANRNAAYRLDELSQLDPSLAGCPSRVVSEDDGSYRGCIYPDRISGKYIRVATRKIPGFVGNEVYLVMKHIEDRKREGGNGRDRTVLGQAYPSLEFALGAVEFWAALHDGKVVYRGHMNGPSICVKKRGKVRWSFYVEAHTLL